MLTTPHVLVAVALSVFIKNPMVLIFAALASHFLFDFFLPHWNPHLYTEIVKSAKLSRKTINFIIADAFLAAGLAIVFAYILVWPDIRQFILIGLAAFFAVLPDAVEIPFYFLKNKNRLLIKYIEFERKYQANAEFLPGMLTQLGVSAVCIVLILANL